VLELSLGDSCIFEVSISYFVESDDAIVGSGAFLGIKISLVPHTLEKLVDVNVTKVVSHVLSEIL
jgi:hypothetical protein